MSQRAVFRAFCNMLRTTLCAVVMCFVLPWNVVFGDITSLPVITPINTNDWCAQNPNLPFCICMNNPSDPSCQNNSGIHIWVSLLCPGESTSFVYAADVQNFTMPNIATECPNNRPDDDKRTNWFCSIARSDGNQTVQVGMMVAQGRNVDGSGWGNGNVVATCAPANNLYLYGTFRFANYWVSYNGADGYVWVYLDNNGQVSDMTHATWYSQDALQTLLNQTNKFAVLKQRKNSVFPEQDENLYKEMTQDLGEIPREFFNRGIGDVDINVGPHVKLKCPDDTVIDGVVPANSIATIAAINDPGAGSLNDDAVAIQMDKIYKMCGSQYRYDADTPENTNAIIFCKKKGTDDPKILGSNFKFCGEAVVTPEVTEPAYCYEWECEMKVPYTVHVRNVENVYGTGASVPEWADLCGKKNPDDSAGCTELKSMPWPYYVLAGRKDKIYKEETRELRGVQFPYGYFTEKWCFYDQDTQNGEECQNALPTYFTNGIIPSSLVSNSIHYLSFWDLNYNSSVLGFAAGHDPQADLEGYLAQLGDDISVKDFVSKWDNKEKWAYAKWKQYIWPIFIENMVADDITGGLPVGVVEANNGALIAKYENNNLVWYGSDNPNYVGIYFPHVSDINKTGFTFDGICVYDKKMPNGADCSKDGSNYVAPQDVNNSAWLPADSTGDRYVYVKWKRKCDLSCDKKQYLPAGAEECEDCPEGSYCLGTGEEDVCFSETVDQGITSCAVEMGNENATNVVVESDDPGECFVPCAEINLGEDYGHLVPSADELINDSDYILGSKCEYIIDLRYQKMPSDNSCNISSCCPNGADANITVNDLAGFNNFAKCQPDVDEVCTPGKEFSEWTLQNVTQITTNPVRNVVVYTLVCKNATYTITYDLDGGQCNGADNVCTPSKYTFEEGVSTLPTATKAGFVFGGWYDDTDAKVESISATDHGNKILHAKWLVHCDAGKYLPHDTAECAPCPQHSFCATGGDYNLNWPEDQGITDTCSHATDGKFPRTYSNDSSRSINRCHISLSFQSNAPDATFNGEVSPYRNVSVFYRDDSDNYRESCSATQAGAAGDTKWCYRRNGDFYVTTTPNFERTGYTLGGWKRCTYTDKGPINCSDDNIVISDAGDAPAYAPVETNATLISTSDLQNSPFIGMVYLYAQWNPIPYYICYQDGAEAVDTPAACSCDGTAISGCGEYDANYKHIYTIEDAFTLPVPERPAVDAENLGWKFGGWYDSATNTKVTKISAGTTQNMTLIAKWTKRMSKIDFVCSPDSSSPLDVQVGKKVNWPTACNGIDVDTWSCSGGDWELIPGETEGEGNIGIIPKSEETITCKPGYRIEYRNPPHDDPEGVVVEDEITVDGHPLNPRVYTSENRVYYPGEKTMNNIGAAAGYKFGGWYTDTGLTHRVDRLAVRSSGKKIVYAKWNAISKCIAGDGVETTEAFITDDIVKCHVTCEDGYSRNGYHDTTTNYDTEAITEDKTVTCKARTYKVNLDSHHYATDDSGATPNSPTTAGTTQYWYRYNTTKQIDNTTCYYFNKDIVNENVESDITNCVTDPLSIPTYAGYEFGGYYSSKLGADTRYVTQDGAQENDVYTTLPTDADKTLDSTGTSRTLYAQWTVVEYDVVYNDKNNDDEWEPVTGLTPESYTVESTAEQRVLPDETVMTKAGYTFAGWYINSELTGSVVESIATNATGTQTFYAKWTPNLISCSGGKYIADNPETCDTPCPAGSYCPAAEYEYTGEEQGKYSCADATENEFTLSAVESEELVACYKEIVRPCSELKPCPDHATCSYVPESISGKQYYGQQEEYNEGEVCNEPTVTACDAGWISTDNMCSKQYKVKFLRCGAEVVSSMGTWPNTGYIGYGTEHDYVLPDETQTSYKMVGYGFTQWCKAKQVNSNTSVCDGSDRFDIGVSTDILVDNDVPNQGTINVCPDWQLQNYDIYYYNYMDADLYYDDYLYPVIDHYNVTDLPKTLKSDVGTVFGYEFKGWCVYNEQQANIETASDCPNPTPIEDWTVDVDDDMQNKYMYAKWERKTISCDGKKYIAANSETCDTPCPAGSYCPAAEYEYTGEVQGKFSCAEATHGEFTKALAESMSQTECYKACPRKDNALPVQAKVYWSDTAEEQNDCEYYSCKWLHVGDDEADKMCLYENRPNGPVLGVRVGTKTYYVPLSTDADVKINATSQKKLRVKVGDTIYNAHDTNVSF